MNNYHHMIFFDKNRLQGTREINNTKGFKTLGIIYYATNRKLIKKNKQNSS